MPLAQVVRMPPNKALQLIRWAASRWLMTFLRQLGSMRQAGIALALLLSVGCTRAGLAPRYLSRCPATGPEAAADLEFRPVPLDLHDFYVAVRARSSPFEIDALGAVRDGDADHPILSIRYRGSFARNRVLVVAGVHGNETAGLLAVPAILDLLEAGRPEYRFSDVTIVAPANPIGVLHGSRYNGDGCDLNRDFHDPRTYEARVIRDFIAAERPNLIVSLHEGPQDGYLLVVTSEGSKRLAEAAVRAVRERGFALASSHFAGFPLRTPGLSAEGGGTDFLKWALRLRTLGSFANSLGIGTYTTETSWSSDDFEERTQAHVVAVEALLLSAAHDGQLAAQQGAAADRATPRRGRPW
jgi:hypothetical protein